MCVRDSANFATILKYVHVTKLDFRVPHVRSIRWMGDSRFYDVVHGRTLVSVDTSRGRTPRVIGDVKRELSRTRSKVVRVWSPTYGIRVVVVHTYVLTDTETRTSCLLGATGVKADLLTVLSGRVPFGRELGQFDDVWEETHFHHESGDSSTV